ncbi:MAG: response regulator [Deltaproteobacteria bacterium]|nr:response regulator [Deltaproteobacteria bacterium]MCW5808772.1 response regulator [Deltaproteobacteria bacterium]
MSVRVLVVHTDAADLAVVASVVAAHGFELRVLEASDDLLGEIARYQPDAVILDVVQRDCDGHDLCRAVKTDPAGAGVPVILTGSADGPEARRRAFAVGCDEFLEKPISRHALAYRLRSFARLRRSWSRRIVDVIQAVAQRSHDDAMAILREEAAHGGIDLELRLALERWLLEKQAHQIEP